MFDTFSKKMRQIFSAFQGEKKLTEENIAQAMREVRLALLDADVHYPIASAFVKRVKEKAVGTDLLRSVKPQEQFVKLVHDELVAFMGEEEAPLALHGAPAILFLCGLQGSGKTTQCVKLAAYLRKLHPTRRLLLAACDLQRPAAIDQLVALASSIDVPVFTEAAASDPLRVALAARDKARREGFDILIVDTAGRLHLDEALMEELKRMKGALEPQEVLFVASAAMGQDAVKVATEFHERVGITGSILTMLDGSARAGAALSIREATRQPLKFEGVGEKVGDLRVFNPRSMADRVLGMGDVINLVKRAEELMDDEQSKELEKKFRQSSFTYEDYLKQMGMMKKMGPLKGVLKMLPGVEGLGDLDLKGNEMEDQFKRSEAMILSMTPAERMERVELVPRRRQRIARGSGVHIDEVNRLIKGFKRLKQFSKEFPKKMPKEKSLWR